MNAQTKPRGHGCLITILIVILLLALVCAAPFLYNRLARYEYDDFAAIAAANDEPVELSVDDDAEHLIVRADKADICSLLDETDLTGRIQAELGSRVKLEQLGYTLTPERAEVRAAVKLLNLIPVQLQANADVSVSAEAVHLLLSDIEIGPWIRVSAEKLAGLTGMSELAEPIDLDIKDYTEPLRVDRIWIENDGVALSSALLGEVLDEVAALGEPYARLLWLYYGDEAPAAAKALVGQDRAGFIRASGETLDALRGSLRDVTALGTDAYRCTLTDDLSTLNFDLNSELERFYAVREEYLGQIADAQRRYREAQLDLRNDYWYKNVKLAAGALVNPDGTPMENRLPDDWEARVVLQYNENYDAIVKTNEGNPRLLVPLPGLPMMSELPRDSKASLPAEGDGPFDLTLAVRLKCGLPSVIWLTAEDEYGLSVIPEELFAEMRENERIPIYSSAEVVTAPRESWIRLTGLEEDFVAGNYAGVPD